ncbi:extended synaptotagmin-1-like protein [Dinothrombium tinctorium]|uniref:Extended synaptotagmin-1-like protein n=1 Tax=Dinothrombium tinctorium TaxID=1965070 RepID=A0A3S3PJT2_9ACAR|nr:extended synaptotagmin-1-like protein [Dinothrombium tinctorium]RWS13970.1 extended synaptotagmin-1-like protein [Dinothrombium tinctorium]
MSAMNTSDQDSRSDASGSKELTCSQLELIYLVKRFGSAFGLLLLAWLIGYTGFSFAWICIGLLVWILRVKYMQQQQTLVTVHRALGEDPKQTITNALQHLPSWVYFPDIERAEWINRVLKQLWPYIDEYAKKLMKTTIEPSVAASLPDYLKSFRFEKVDLGTIPVRIGGIKCYDTNTSRKEIILDLEIIYAGNCDINIKVKGLSAGIKDLQIYGTMRVEMRPLLKEMPIVGGLSFYFLTNPVIEFNLTNLADILDFPGLSDVLRKAISEQLAAFIVLPNKYVFPLTDLPMKTLKFTPPMGVVRLEVIEGRQLKKADIGVLGMGKSDPYCNISIAAQNFKTHVINSSINPRWNFVCEAVLHHVHGQSIAIEVMDEDQGSKDDFLGRTSLALDLVTKNGRFEDWLVLEDTETGSIYVKATWLKLSTDITQLDKQIETVNKWRATRTKKEEKHSPLSPSVAAVFIYLDSANNLPSFTKTAPEPSPFVVFLLGNEKRQSSVKTDISNPVWEETFYFLVGDPRREHELKAEIIDSKANKTIGNVVIKLSDLLTAERMTLDQFFPIKGKGRECTLCLTVELRILSESGLESHKNPPKMQEDETDKKDNQSPNESNKEPERVPIPSIEEMVFSTIEPILDTSGGEKDLLLDLQPNRKPLEESNNVRRRRYDNDEKASDDVD